MGEATVMCESMAWSRLCGSGEPSESDESIAASEPTAKLPNASKPWSLQLQRSPKTLESL